MKKRYLWTVALVAVLLAFLVVPVSASASAQSDLPVVDLLPEAITMLAAGALSLLFAYFPVLRTRFAALPAEVKSGLMILLLVVTTGAVMGLSCAGVLQVNGFQCDRAGFIRAVWMFFLAVSANQGTYKLAPEMNDVRLAKQGRYLEYYG